MNIFQLLRGLTTDLLSYAYIAIKFAFIAILTSS